MSKKQTQPPLVATITITLSDGTNRRQFTETIEASDGCPDCMARLLGGAVGRGLVSIGGPGGGVIAAEYVTDAFDDMAGFFAEPPEDSGDDFDDGDGLDNDE